MIPLSSCNYGLKFLNNLRQTPIQTDSQTETIIGLVEQSEIQIGQRNTHAPMKLDLQTIALLY